MKYMTVLQLHILPVQTLLPRTEPGTGHVRRPKRFTLIKCNRIAQA